jgi:hypothetical protein
MAECYLSYAKQNLMETTHWLLKQECCDQESCSDLARDSQDLQFKCNDLFGESNIILSNRDDKGNMAGTFCSLLKDKKINALNKLRKFEELNKLTQLESGGGKKNKSKRQSKRKSKRQKSKSRKTRRR